MFNYIKTTLSSSRYIHYNLIGYSPLFSRSQAPDNTPFIPRCTSQVGSDDYKRSLRRAFARTKLLVFLNPDMTQFITLTYAKNQKDLKQSLQDFKNMIRNQKNYNTKHNITTKPKYIYIYEYQKRGALHIHMISNNYFTTYKNKNGYRSLRHWSHGYSSLLTLSDFDKNFRAYAYLFKYMHKTERIGQSFIHTSRTFDKIINVDYDSYIKQLAEDRLLYTDDLQFTLPNTIHKARIIKKYYEKSLK